MASKKTGTTMSTAANDKQPAPTAAAKSTTTTGPTHDQISKRAYELYLARGGQHGRHHDDWTQAERELKLGRQ